MPADDAALTALVAEVGRFHVTDRAMRRAQERIGRVLAAGTPASPAETARYLRSVEAYFGRFEREARMRLREVDRRLAKAAQLQFNLTAERGVAVKRVDITQGVLARLRELGHR